MTRFAIKDFIPRIGKKVTYYEDNLSLREKMRIRLYLNRKYFFAELLNPEPRNVASVLLLAIRGSLSIKNAVLFLSLVGNLILFRIIAMHSMLNEPDPRMPITRAHFMIMLARSIAETQKVTWPNDCDLSKYRFEDIKSTDPLAKNCEIAFLIDEGIVTGEKQGLELDPAKTTMRIVAARLLAYSSPKAAIVYNDVYRNLETRCLNTSSSLNGAGWVSVSEALGVNEFADLSKPQTYDEGGWYYYCAHAVVAAGIIEEARKHNFDPVGPVTYGDSEKWLCTGFPGLCENDKLPNRIWKNLPHLYLHPGDSNLNSRRLN
jgi:hypothetical protein